MGTQELTTDHFGHREIFNNFTIKMSKGAYKLTYFDGKGRGEVARLLFAAGGAKFEDKRIKFEDWPALKPKTPLGTLPILEVDGKSLSQSYAINRFLARKFGLSGKNDWDEGRVNEICDTSVDFFGELTKTMFGDDASKAEADKKVKEELGPKYLAGSALTLADLSVYQTLEGLVGKTPEVLDKYPQVKANRKKVAESKGIKEWLAKRPVTAF